MRSRLLLPVIAHAAAPSADVSGAAGTSGYGINTSGAISGKTLSSGNVFSGFVRAADGTITTFSAPDAGTGADQGTFALGINTSGVISGEYLDANNVFHGFVRAADGTLTSFDPPGVGTDEYQGTQMYVDSINTAGSIAGYYLDSSNVYHAFIRSK